MHAFDTISKATAGMAQRIKHLTRSAQPLASATALQGQVSVWAHHGGHQLASAHLSHVQGGGFATA
jgi:hypothetical protein